jgi:hypothetical protein
MQKVLVFTKVRHVASSAYFRLSTSHTRKACFVVFEPENSVT